MKINKTILAAVLGLGAVSVASADEIYFTGSTAARSSVYQTLTNVGSVFSSAPIVTGFGNSGASDTYVAFAGTLVGGSGTTIINCHWSGSEAGIVDCANQTPETFIADSLISTTTSSDSSSGTPGTTQTHQADLCMADNAQAYSPSGKNYSALTGNYVGTVPFHWVRNPGLWTGTNISDAQIRQALNGGVKLAVFSGNAGDTNSYVYVAGRDSSSGTRVNAFGDCGFGASTPPSQIEVLSSGAMALLNSITNRGVVFNYYIGNYGQSSGGTLATTMGYNTVGATDSVHTNATGGYSVIGYVGASDYSAHSTDGMVPCSYNGVPYNNANIEEGTYTFWGNEYVYQTLFTTGESPNITSVLNDLLNVSTGVNANADGQFLISRTAMHCTRTSPAADPTHN